MKKNYLLLVFALIFAGVSFAQTPTFSNQAGGISNAFPLNSLTTQRKVQWFIPALSLGSLTTPWMITQVWFQAGTGATQVYPILNVKLKSGATMTSLSGTTMEPGMTLVFTATNYTLTTTSGTWFTFTLQTPFYYDPNDPLIVELEHNATTGTGPGVYQTAITATGPTRQYGDYNTNTLSGSDATRRINFGIEVVTACNISISSSASGTNNASICSGSTLTLTTNAVSNYSWSTSATTSSIVVSPTATTVYSLTATSPSNCTASKSYTVNVATAVPVLTVASSANTVCLGKTVTLTASGAQTYTWSHGAANGGSFIPTSTLIYTVNGQNGCGISTATTSILVGPLPVTISAVSSSVCAGNITNFTVNAAANSFTWLPQNAISQNSIIAVSPTATTIYTVSVSDGTCVGSGTINLVANPVPTISIAATGSTVCKGDTITMTANGGINYTWTPSTLNGTMVSVTPTTASSYQVAGSNSFGCTSAAGHVVLVDLPPNMTANFTNTTVCTGSTVYLATSGATSYTWGTSANTQTISYAANANTVISVTGGHNTNTCVATKQFSINAVTPVLPVSAAIAICQGAVTTLTAGPGSGFSWSPAGGGLSLANVSPTISTIFTVTANVISSGITCKANSTVMVTVNQLPTIIATAPSTVMCRKENIVITASGATSYTWSTLAQSPSITFSSNVASTQTLSVSGTDVNGCVNTGSILVKTNQCNAITENEGLAGFRVYPVPSKGEVYMQSDLDCELNIVALSGQIVKVITLTAENGHKVRVNLSPGVYLVQSKKWAAIEKACD